MLRRNKAFTLAEVLITLGIIGIVASMTIPQLIMNYQKNQYVTMLKKGYTEIQQVFKLYMADQGVTDLSQTELFVKNADTAMEDTPERLATLHDMVNKYFKVARDCYTDSCDDIKSVKALRIDPAQGSSDEYDSTCYYFCTVDGICFAIYLNTQDKCLHDGYPSMRSCALINMDTNGPKPPNQWGRDYFDEFYLGNDGTLYVFETYSWFRHYYNFNQNWLTFWSPHSCGTLTSLSGAYGDGCAARIVEDGWEMNY